MKRRQVVLAAAAVPAMLAGCAAPVGFNPYPGGVSGMVGGAQRHLGLNTEQTLASLGSMFALAKNKLSAAEYARVGTTLPGLDDVVDRGASVGGFAPSSMTSTQAVADAVAKFGVNRSQLTALGNYVTGSLSGSNASSAANLLSSAWR
jgi:hypothetical protein